MCHLCTAQSERQDSTAKKQQKNEFSIHENNSFEFNVHDCVVNHSTCHFDVPRASTRPLAISELSTEHLRFYRVCRWNDLLRVIWCRRHWNMQKCHGKTKILFADFYLFHGVFINPANMNSETFFFLLSRLPWPFSVILSAVELLMTVWRFLIYFLMKKILQYFLGKNRNRIFIVILWQRGWLKSITIESNNIQNASKRNFYDCILLLR